MKSVKKLFLTTVALTMTSFLMKTVAVWFNVYLTGLVGTVGIGIFQLIMSVYALSKTVAYGGMNLAGTRLCIDDYEKRRYLMKRVLWIALLLGGAAMLILYSFSDIIAKGWIIEPSAGSALRILSLSLPFISLSAALNGYMTASRRMSRYSVIQLLEQVAKIGLTVLFAGHLYAKSDSSIDLVCLAITFSEVFSFSLAFLFFCIDLKRDRAPKAKGKHFLRKMARLALPDAFGSWIRSGLNTLEHLLIPHGIRKSGASVDKAFSDYGIVQGMALPVVLYPSSILGVISGLLVPEIAECKIKNNKIQVNYIINRVLHVSLIFSFLIMSFMLCFAKEISLGVYHNTGAESFIRLIAPLIPIMYLDMTTDGMLKGLDMQLDIMKINVIDSVLCVALVALLVPRVAVEGYIITIYVAEIINFILSFHRLNRSAGLLFSLRRNFFGPLFSSTLAMMCAKKAAVLIKETTPGLFFAAGVGIAMYYILLRITGSVSKEDSKWFLGLIRPEKQS